MTREPVHEIGNRSGVAVAFFTHRSIPFSAAAFVQSRCDGLVKVTRYPQRTRPIQSTDEVRQPFVGTLDHRWCGRSLSKWPFQMREDHPGTPFFRK